MFILTQARTQGASVAFLDGTPPRVIAHRGLATHHAENTLGAFGAALEAGADILETDVHLSKDGVVIIAHDSDLERVAHRSGLVSEFTAVELSDMDLGHGEGFPTLTQALHTFPEARWNIDLKIPGVVDPCVHAVMSAGAVDRILVTSFNEDTRARAVHALVGVASSATSRHIMAGRIISWMGLPLSSWKLPGDIVALQIPPAHAGLALVTPSMIRLAHRKGLEVHVWTINEVKDMERLWSMGVDAIVTDRADLAVEVRRNLP
jgi:glycerophosphoryl diester phosphodiesterase